MLLGLFRLHTFLAFCTHNSVRYFLQIQDSIDSPSRFNFAAIPARETCTKASCCAVNRSKMLQCIPLGCQPLPLRMPGVPNSVSCPFRPVIPGFALAEVGQPVAVTTGEDTADIKDRHSATAATGGIETRGVARQGGRLCSRDRRDSFRPSSLRHQIGGGK